MDSKQVALQLIEATKKHGAEMEALKKQAEELCKAVVKDVGDTVREIDTEEKMAEVAAHITDELYKGDAITESLDFPVSCAVYNLMLKQLAWRLFGKGWFVFARMWLLAVLGG